METFNNLLIKCHIKKTLLTFLSAYKGYQKAAFWTSLFLLKQALFTFIFNCCPSSSLLRNQNFAIPTNVAIFLAVSMVT